jgi:hypothetical protein
MMALCRDDEAEVAEGDEVARHARQLMRLLQSAQNSSLDHLAQLLLERDVHLARVHLQSFQQLLDAAGG